MDVFKNSQQQTYLWGFFIMWNFILDEFLFSKNFACLQNSIFLSSICSNSSIVGFKRASNRLTNILDWVQHQSFLMTCKPRSLSGLTSALAFHHFLVMQSFDGPPSSLTQTQQVTKVLQAWPYSSMRIWSRLELLMDQVSARICPSLIPVAKDSDYLTGLTGLYLGLGFGSLISLV